MTPRVDKIRILLVEDNPRDVELVLAMLRPHTFLDFTHVNTLAKATAAIENQFFDLILTDLNLPDSEGLNTLCQMQAAAGSIPVVILTGHSDSEMKLEAAKMGAHDFLEKGTVNGNLITAIRSAFARRQERLDELQKQCDLIEQKLGGVVQAVFADMREGLLSGKRG